MVLETLETVTANLNNQTIEPNQTIESNLAVESNHTIEPSLTIESNQTVEPNFATESNQAVEPTLAAKSNQTVEPNLTIESNQTIEPNLTESNQTIEPNLTVESNQTIEFNLTVESNHTIESNQTINSNQTIEPNLNVTIPNSLYLFVVAALAGPTVLPWKDALTKSYQDVTDDRVLRSLSYDLARKARSCPARSFAVGSTLSSDLTFSQPVIVNSDASPILCLVFSGQGPQHVAMGRELCAAYPVFLSAVKQCDEILVETYGHKSFLERTGLFIPGEKAKVPENQIWPIEEVVYSIVFMQLALVDLIKSLGIEYTYAIGHR